MVYAASRLHNHAYLIEEDELPSPEPQIRTLIYLRDVLQWQFRADGWGAFIDLACFHAAIRNDRQMIVPDLAVFLGITLTPQERDSLTSWDLRAGRLCPPVVVEVSNEGTWRTDVGTQEDHKPVLYGQIGVREYIAHDPNRPALWRDGRRVRLWRYDGEGRPQEAAADERGWLWSAELASWLGVEGTDLRLYDADGNIRPTQAQAERAARLHAEAQEAAERTARLHAEAELAALRKLLDERS